ncbi:hypothetical protein [Streptomyces sp. NPDC058466]|uniref:hypothetical protein n=1 Tax=Streptomyces sp. NPDC058466 TaxID=3346512 RepID=UPI003651F102
MRVFLPLTAVTTAALLLVTVTGATPAAADRNPDGTPLVKVSQGDPYAKCTIGARSPDSIVYPATEVEPYLSVDPRDPKRVVTVSSRTAGTTAAPVAWRPAGPRTATPSTGARCRSACAPPTARTTNGPPTPG